jgi:hypothetical protein
LKQKKGEKKNTRPVTLTENNSVTLGLSLKIIKLLDSQNSDSQYSCIRACLNCEEADLMDTTDEEDENGDRTSSYDHHKVRKRDSLED